MMSIALTQFAVSRHFSPTFAGTKVGNYTPEEFCRFLPVLMESGQSIKAPGYADFCKHLFVPNFTDARLGVAEITPENEHLLKTGFKARREFELATLGRWFEGLSPERAPWLDVVLYSKEQLLKEVAETGEAPDFLGEADWYIVAILSATSPEETPIDPTTQMRNALSKTEGGSGVPIDREAYNKAVGYWNRHANVK